MEIYDFGMRLKQLRKDKKMSQKEVAERIGVVDKTISAYERNIQVPRLETLIELASLYNSSVDYILGFTNRTNIYIDELTEKQKNLLLNLLKEFEETNALIKKNKNQK